MEGSEGNAKMLHLIASIGLVISGDATATDGDTLRFKYLDQSIRIWGIDAPEMSQEGGEAAKAALSAMLRTGVIRCEVRGRDRYKRLVARCENGAGDLARQLIDQGAAKEWCRYSKGHYGGC